MTRAGDGSEILELTRMVNKDGTVTDLRHGDTSGSGASSDPAETTRQTDTGDTPPVQSAAKSTATAEDESKPVSPSTPSGIDPTPSSDLGESTAANAASFAPSARTPDKDATPASAPASAGIGAEGNSAWIGHNQTLEALVLEAIEPKIRAWLDANMERIVEQVVQQKVDVPSAQLEKSAREMVRRELRAILSRLDEG